MGPGHPPRIADLRRRQPEEDVVRQVLGAVGIADAQPSLGGTEEGFVVRMNAKAQELGLRSTHYSNAHGLPDPAQRSTATRQKFSGGLQ